MPVDEETRADFFDSIFHSAAVVGINTTAMIEAAVVGRSVHTVLDPAFANSQRNAFHFDYLLEVGGGAVRAAESYDAHRANLAAAVAGEDDDAVRREAFLLASCVLMGSRARLCPGSSQRSRKPQQQGRHRPLAYRPGLPRSGWHCAGSSGPQR